MRVAVGLLEVDSEGFTRAVKLLSASFDELAVRIALKAREILAVEEAERSGLARELIGQLREIGRASCRERV